MNYTRFTSHRCYLPNLYKEDYIYLRNSFYASILTSSIIPPNYHSELYAPYVTTIDQSTVNSEYDLINIFSSNQIIDYFTVGIGFVPDDYSGIKDNSKVISIGFDCNLFDSSENPNNRYFSLSVSNENENICDEFIKFIDKSFLNILKKINGYTILPIPTAIVETKDSFKHHKWDFLTGIISALIGGIFGIAATVLAYYLNNN